MKKEHLILKKIKNHFKKVDPVLYKAIKDLYLLEKVPPKDYFAKLCGEIINRYRICGHCIDKRISL